MVTESLDQLFNLNKSFSAPLTELNKITTTCCKRIADQNLEIIADNVSRFSSQLKRLSSVKKPDELLNVQREIVNENIAAGLEITQKLMHMTLENMEEFSKASKAWGSTAAKITEKAVEKARG